MKSETNDFVKASNGSLVYSTTERFITVCKSMLRCLVPYWIDITRRQIAAIPQYNPQGRMR